MASGLHPYLNFPGTSREAFELYGKALGAEPKFATFGEFHAVPEGHEASDKIKHGSLEVSDVIKLYVSDTIEGMSPDGIVEGNSVTLSLMGDDAELTKKAFATLAEDGTVVMPLQKQIWGDVYGQVKDRYGITWQFNIAGGAPGTEDFEAAEGVEG